MKQKKQEPDQLYVSLKNWEGSETQLMNDGQMTTRFVLDGGENRTIHQEREAFCASATEKRAELNIRALKYGADKDAGHTNGRWYARSEAYRSVRKKVDGDYEIEGAKLTAEQLIADDLADIETQLMNDGQMTTRFVLDGGNDDKKILQTRSAFRGFVMALTELMGYTIVEAYGVEQVSVDE